MAKIGEICFRVCAFRGKQLPKKYFLEFLVFRWRKVNGQRKYFQVNGKSPYKIVKLISAFEKGKSFSPSLRMRSLLLPFFPYSFSPEATISALFLTKPRVYNLIPLLL